MGLDWSPASRWTEDAIADAILRGKPLHDVLVIDGHAHLAQERTVQGYYPHAAPDEIVASMDRFGIDVACISGIGPDTQNAAVAAAVERHRGRLLGFALFNPRYDDSGQALEKHLASGLFGGIGEVHPTSYHNAYPITGEAYAPMWELAAEYRVPVLVHSGPDAERKYCAPALIGEAASRYPGVKVLLGHCGAYGNDPWALLEEATEVARANSDVYLDLCGTGRHLGIVEYAVARIGDERVVFGTDATFHGWGAEVAHVALADLPEQSKRRILGANMAGLLREGTGASNA